MITCEQIVTADGFAQDSDGGMAFTEMVEFDDVRTDTAQMRWLESVEAILLGRRTYELFASYWPTADPAVDAIAGPMASLPKYVVSSTLSRAPWGDGEIEILRGGAASAAYTVNRRHRSVVVWGSLDLTTALLGAGLVDALRLRVVPAVIGSGRGWGAASLGPRRLALRDVERLTTGHVTLAYDVLG